MNFSEALDKIKEGNLLQRKNWNGKGLFIFLVDGSNFKVSRKPLINIFPEGTDIEYRPHIDMKDADGKVVPWLASQTDILADDWQIVDKIN